LWEGGIVTTANKNGGFSFSFGVVPTDCVGTLSDGVTTIDVKLSNCTPRAGTGAGLLRTGQTQCYASGGGLISCTGTGQDGEGVARSYTDNPDGTITDNASTLIWEKLTADTTSIHYVNTIYDDWSESFGKIARL
jgi:hypothetical protein